MKILIGYDGSDEASAAISDLVRAGLPREGEAAVMAVADVFPFLLEGEAPRFAGTKMLAARREAALAVAQAQDLARDGAEQVLRSLPHWRVNSEAAAGSPYWEFVDRSDAGRVDLILVGSRGRAGVAALLGSVSLNVLHHASCTVRIGRRSKRTGADAPARIVAAFDGSSEAAAAVRAAAARSWPAGSELRIVTAIHGRTFELLAGSEPGADEFQALGAQLRDDLRSRMEVSLVQRDDEPKQMILREADRWEADCIFLGARGLSRFQRAFLGSVSGAVAARASCSVEIVKEPRERA